MNSDFPKMKQIKLYSRDLEQMAIPYFFHRGFVRMKWSHFSKYCICAFWIFDTAQLHSKSRLISKRKKSKMSDFTFLASCQFFGQSVFTAKTALLFSRRIGSGKSLYLHTRDLVVVVSIENGNKFIVSVI